MKRILSNEQCNSLIKEAQTLQWERVDRFGQYYQAFIIDNKISKTIQNYFGKEVAEEPILKVLKFNEGDSIPTFSADYSNKEDEYFKRYINTNFIVQIYLNSDFEGGILSRGLESFVPNIGYGLTQNKTDKCSISKIEKGVGYFLFVFISKIKPTSLL